MNTEKLSNGDGLSRCGVQLSVVVPCYNEADVLPEFHRRMARACRTSNITEFEIIYVNDGSSDRTLQVINELQRQDPCVGMVDLSRNHGHQLALSAGLVHATGALVLTIDADLQDPPELLLPMMQKIADGADVVYAQRNVRKGESILKRVTATGFYRLLSSTSSTPIHVDTGDFRLMTRRIVDLLVAMPEAHRFIRGLVSWIGFVQVPIGYDRDARFAGETKYPFFKMLAFSLDAFTAFATAPLRIVFVVSMLAMCLALIVFGWTIYSYQFIGTVPGWASVMVVLLFFTSIQLFALAFIGEFVGRIFIESKRRPLFLVRSFSPPASKDTPATAPHDQQI